MLVMRSLGLTGVGKIITHPVLVHLVEVPPQ